jgi:hypothetical protein
MCREYKIGQYYLEGTILKFIRRGNPQIISVEYDPDEAADQVATISNYSTGIRIFTNTDSKARKKNLTLKDALARLIQKPQEELVVCIMCPGGSTQEEVLERTKAREKLKKVRARMEERAREKELARENV